MTSSPEHRTVVLRGAATERAHPARISSDLRTSPFVSRLTVDPRLVDPTLEAVVKEAEERARVLGWERGRLEGREAALREGAAAAAVKDEAQAVVRDAAERRREDVCARAADALHARTAELDARHAPVFEDIDHSIAVMAVEIAEVLVGRHLELGKWPALDAVQRALALAPRRAAAILRVHPDTVNELPDVSDALPGGSVTLVSDPAIEIDGCVVEAGDRTIDAQLGTALQRLREVLA